MTNREAAASPTGCVSESATQERELIIEAREFPLRASEKKGISP